MQQLALAFEPGLSERHRSLLDCVRECVYRCAKPMKAIAADMDLSESDLSRKLSGNPDDPRRFSVDDLERCIRATGDLTPIHYLAEKYALDANIKQAVATAEFVRFMPQMIALFKQMSGGLGDEPRPAKGGKR